MPSRNPHQRLKDIRGHIEAANSFVEGLTLDDFRRDSKTIFATLRALEVISEASRRLPDEMRSRHPEIDWHAIAAAGNIWRHEYDRVDSDVVWYAVRDDLPPLLRVVEFELAATTSDPTEPF